MGDMVSAFKNIHDKVAYILHVQLQYTWIWDHFQFLNKQNLICLNHV